MPKLHFPAADQPGVLSQDEAAVPHLLQGVGERAPPERAPALLTASSHHSCLLRLEFVVFAVFVLLFLSSNVHAPALGALQPAFMHTAQQSNIRHRLHAMRTKPSFLAARRKDRRSTGSSSGESIAPAA